MNLRGRVVRAERQAAERRREAIFAAWERLRQLPDGEFDRRVEQRHAAGDWAERQWLDVLARLKPLTDEQLLAVLRDVAAGRRVGKLYLPPGARYFGCRLCYDLTYTSCQESHKYDRLHGLMAAEMGEDLRTARWAMREIGKRRE
jgi:hypothetical protein